MLLLRISSNCKKANMKLMGKTTNQLMAAVVKNLAVSQANPKWKIPNKKKKKMKKIYKSSISKSCLRMKNWNSSTK